MQISRTGRARAPLYQHERVSVYKLQQRRKPIPRSYRPRQCSFWYAYKNSRMATYEGRHNYRDMYDSTVVTSDAFLKLFGSLV